MDIKIAVVGLAHPHIYDFLNEALGLDGVRLTGIVEEDATTRLNASKRYGQVPAFETMDDLLESVDVDLIATAAVNNRKADIIVNALKKGKHVISDKPLVTTMEDLERVKEAFREAGPNARLCMLLTERYNPSLVTAKQVIDSGEIGEIVNCIALRPHRLAPSTRPLWMFNRKEYGGIIVDLAIHDIDILRWFTGSDIAKIFAAHHSNSRFRQFKEFEDNGEIFLALDNGSTAFIRVDWLTPDGYPHHGDCRVLVVGTKGQVEARTIESRVEVFSDTHSPREVPLCKRPSTLAEDLIRSILDPEYEPVIRAEDIFEATRVSLEARAMADTGDTPWTAKF
ncbi:MAG: Gfo/Idh/MocA family oxidoreductase [Firmicutes bacterium]|nr:Gfo/Idh/MocA family oxidoreductase [Bacillota bacterium]